jgi:glutaredoxin
MAEFELFGTASCPFTQELRDWLDWKGRDFVEYDVEADADALKRMQTLTEGQRTVPVLFENGKVIQVGWQGRGCVVNSAVKADNI